MEFSNVAVAGVACHEAPHRITSEEIENQLAETMERLRIAPGLLAEGAGIQARRFWDEGIKPSDAATAAAEIVLEKTQIDRTKMGVLVNTSVCRDYIEPSTACLVHRNLKLARQCANFDLGSACIAFLTGMEVVAGMIELGLVDYGMVVDGEGSRSVVEKTIERLRSPKVDRRTFRENFATLTLGSGAAAMILARSSLVPDGHPYLGGLSLAASEHAGLCYGQTDHMVTRSREMLIAGLELADHTWSLAAQHMRWSAGQIDQFAIHQISKVHTEQLATVLELDRTRIVEIYPEYGNTGPASIPMALRGALDGGRIQRGDRVALMGIGSGLNSAVAEIVW